LPKWDLTTDAEYVANLVDVNVGVANVKQCRLLRGYIYLIDDIFLTIIGYCRLNVVFIPPSEILGTPLPLGWSLISSSWGGGCAASAEKELNFLKLCVHLYLLSLAASVLDCI